MPSASKKVYFPGLNGLRFFAAFAVIFTHIELIKMAFGIRHFWKHPVFFNLGGLGVYFFFVLSGFLITYLLLAEKQLTGTIAVKKFYFRRMFRIWPLYYLVFIIGFAVLPLVHAIDIGYLQQAFSKHFLAQFLSYLLLLPNLGYALHGPVPHIGQLWTIGVEEQFYILWPLLIKVSRKPLRLLIWLIVALVSAKCLVLMATAIEPQLQWLHALKEFMAMLKIECMAIGGIGAYLLLSNNTMWLKIIFNQGLHLFSWFIIPVLIFYTPDVLQNGVHLVYAAFFTVIILNISSNPGSWIKMENKLLNFLGRLSYGVYMYHLMLIPMVLFAFKYFGIDPGKSITLNILLYICVIGLTLVISAVSYRYFESYFLKLKKRFSIIQSV